MAYKQVKHVKWTECWKCKLPIVVQVGDNIPAGLKVVCPNCGDTRSLDRGSFMQPVKIPAMWKKEVLKSIGIEED